jgi:hypothetical protein
MSRHRDFRNININGKPCFFGQYYAGYDLWVAELEDDALSDGGEEEMTPEQQGLPAATLLASVQSEYIQAQMNDGLEQVRLVIGGEAASGLSDTSIKDALWEYYFDVEKTIYWAVGMCDHRILPPFVLNLHS